MAASNKAPAFQFYPNDWLSSQSVALMTPEQEGAYIHLLCYAWMSPDCGIPDDDDTLATLSRMGERWLTFGSTVVRKCFVKRGERLFNDRLLTEKKKQDAWTKKSRAAGIASGKSRRLNKISNEPPFVNGSRLVEPNGNSSSSSSSSSSDLNTEEENTRAQGTSLEKAHRATPGLAAFEDEFKEAWNAAAKRTGMPRMVDWTPARLNLARWAWNKEFFREHWRQALDAVVNCSPLRENRNTGWKLTCDQFLRETTVMQICERAESQPLQDNIRAEDGAEFKI